MAAENGIADKITLGPEQEYWQKLGLEHTRYNYALESTDTVLDIGSYRGEFSNKIKEKYGCHVECFEALDNRAAWLFDGEIEMGGQYLYTSLFNTDNRQKYKCVDIARFIDKEIALVKINIEGGEYQLIQYMISKGLMKFIKHLQIQFHIVESFNWRYRYEKICTELSFTHKISWRYPFVWESWERL